MALQAGIPIGIADVTVAVTPSLDIAVAIEPPVMTLNLCQAGHDWHWSKDIRIPSGHWFIWDWRRYMDFQGYCTGQDDVSMSLDVYGSWERPDIKRMVDILKEKPGPVLDFGAHLGWYAIQAAALHCDVYAVEADPENTRLLNMNAELRDLSLDIQTAWAKDADLPTLDHIRFLKSDVEAHEFDVIDLTRPHFQNRTVDHALLEISPTFRPGYPELVDELIGYGYDAYIIKDEEDWHITGADVVFPQENAWLSKL